MRIAQVVNSLDYGGLERLAVELAAGLAARGHEAPIICLEYAGPLADAAQARKVRVIALHRRPGVDLWAVVRLAGLLRRERIDLVHTHNMGPLAYGTVAARLAGIPRVVNTRHGREEKRSPGWVWRMNQAVVAISNDARARLLQFNRVDPSRVQVIYNGVELPALNGRDRTAARAALGLRADGPVIGTVARLAEEKDQATLLRAVAALRTALPVQLVLVGDGALRPELEALARTLGIQDQVVFLGFRSDACELMRIFDVFALPSRTEGLSLTLLEAMAAGKPVVTTCVGGTPEVVQNGRTGFLVPSRNPARLADALARCIQNPHLAASFGAAGRARVAQLFSLERMIEAHERLYETLGHH